MGLPPKSKISFIIELNDNYDMGILKSLLDPMMPENIVLLNTDEDLFNK
jgi:hypothetical protein